MAVTTKIFDTLLQTNAPLSFNRMLRNAETLGRFFLGQTVDFSQSDYLAATLRQRLDRPNQNLKILRMCERLRDADAFVCHGQRINLRRALRPFDALMPQVVQREIARRHKKKSPRARDRPRRMSLHQPRVGLLHKIVRVGHD